MASIFQLFGEIYVDNSKANAGIDETTTKGKAAGEKMGGSLGKLGDVAGKVGKVVAGVGLTMATAAIAGAAALGREAMQSSDEIQRLADVTGYSAEQIQVMQYQGAALGVDLETMTGAQSKLTKAMDAAAKSIAVNGKDSKKALNDQAQAFAELGVSVVDSNGNLRDSKTVMAEALEALGGMTNETERDAMSMKLLGKSAMELNPLIKAGAGGLAELEKQARDTGAVMSNEAVSGMDNFGDKMDGLKQSLVSMAGGVLSSAMPSLQKLMDLFVSKLPMIQGLLDKIIPIVVNLFDALLPPILDLIESLLPPLLDIIVQLLPFVQTIITTLLPVFIQLIDMLLPPFMQIIQSLLPLLLAIIEPLLPLLQPILSLLQPLIDLLLMIVEPLVQLLNLVLPPLIALFAVIIKTILPPLQWALEQVSKAIGGKLKGAFDALRPVLDAFKRYLGGVIEFITGVFTGNWGKAWDGIKKIFGGIWDGLVAAAKFPINLIIDGLNKFLSGMNKIKIPSWVPLIGGKGFSIPTIPRLKVGLDYVPTDDYPALLHKGERVMTAKENASYAKGSGGITINIGTFVNNTTKDMQQLAEELEYYRARVSYAGGG